MATLVQTEPLRLDIPDGLPDEVYTGTVALIVPMQHPMAEVLAREEARFFDEAPVLFDVPGKEQLFTFLVISVEGAARHIMRLSAPALTGNPQVLPYFLTDLLDSDPDLTLDDLRDYYSALDIDVERFISVETQFRLGDHLEPIRSADLAYVSLFRMVVDRGGPGVVAHLNAMTIASFKRVGMNWHPFAGRIDLRTPTLKEDGTVGFDSEYQPVCMPYRGNEQLLIDIAPLTPPLYWL